MFTGDDVAAIIGGHAHNKPRNRQKAVGPSSLGTPCQRRLGYMMLDVDKVNTSDPLAAWIGTAAHAAMEQALAGDDDWETEIPVELPGYGIRGTCDAYSASRRLAVDWKFVAPATLKKAKAHGPGDQYRVQAHTYGLALDMAGRPVDTVAVAMVPKSGGTLHGIHVWSEPLDHQVVEDALARYEWISQATTAGGTAVLPILATGDAYCSWCPYWMPAATDLTEACPGHQDLPRLAEETQPSTTQPERFSA